MPQSKTGEIVGTLGYMKKRGSLKILIIALVIGAILLLIGSVGLFEKQNAEAVGDGHESDKYTSFIEYKKGIEQEIKTVCESVSGISCISVVAVFDGMGESIYAQDTQSGNSEKNEYVIIGSGSSSHALYLGESLPKLSGIGVVCRSDGETARNELTALLAATYGLSMTRIYVAKAD